MERAAADVFERVTARLIGVPHGLPSAAPCSLIACPRNMAGAPPATGVAGSPMPFDDLMGEVGEPCGMFTLAEGRSNKKQHVAAWIAANVCTVQFPASAQCCCEKLHLSTPTHIVPNPWQIMAVRENISTVAAAIAVTPKRLNF